VTWVTHGYYVDQLVVLLVITSFISSSSSTSIILCKQKYQNADSCRIQSCDSL